MKAVWRCVMLGWLFVGTCFGASAQRLGDPTPLAYQNAREEARFHALTAELRCVQCQNQSLADSNAQIAHDLRREVLSLMREGRSDDQIKQFLVSRYGEFVLYRPLLDWRTAPLWFAPVALLLLVGVLGWRAIARHSGAPVPPQKDERAP